VEDNSRTLLYCNNNHDSEQNTDKKEAYFFLLHDINICKNTYSNSIGYRKV